MADAESLRRRLPGGEVWGHVQGSRDSDDFQHPTVLKQILFLRNLSTD